MKKMPEFNFLGKFEKNLNAKVHYNREKYLPKTKESIKIQANGRKNKEH